MSDLFEIDGIPFDEIVEAVIFAADKPLSGEAVCKTLQITEPELDISEDDIAASVERLNISYENSGRAFRITLRGGGYTFATEEKMHRWLKVFQHENAMRKISQSALETLAIIAYKQPVTKPEVDNIRGVDSAYVVRQLLEKGLLEVAGRYDGPGRALLYKTTSVFLSHFGMNSIAELPKPREIEEILKDDDMAEHRQLMLELKAELAEKSISLSNGDDETESESPKD